MNLPVDCEVDLIDQVTEMSVLICGYKLWGYENVEISLCIHLKFLKHMLNSKM